MKGSPTNKDAEIQTLTASAKTDKISEFSE